ncbi:MBL fold metallo-hydrolase [Bacillus sp. KH172YL63]|uniref:MBL fold metallo-hydrolase n=1 Tax=Bacillus sp. KH172YL63 TaxID=2709784 RepID=UPI0013E49AD3|nr:MBL fold metallo-hydrolase [Bacillus sp. KH172YL63]BCB03168.1 MBL fold metallo-hydrolase [Bacillus sp. KH172YL63]
MSIHRIDSRISLVDLMDLSMHERTGSYIIKEKSLTIIETSASPSIPHLKKGLSKLNINLEDIQYIILTHIHLDHAGGAGLFLQECPNATVIVHPKARRHLVDPSRLISGAKAVYGDKFDALFHPIIPIPEERIRVMEDRESLDLSETCTLTFYHTPGHANHHFSILDSVSNGMFTGDTSGIQYRVGPKRFYFPSTSPNQFNPDQMRHAIQLYKECRLDRLYFGHFGETDQVTYALSEVEEHLERFMEISKEHFVPSLPFEENVKNVTSALFHYASNWMTRHDVAPDHPVRELLILDMQVSAMGIVDYFMKKPKGESTA